MSTYLHTALNQKPSKWRDIDLFNQANKMSSEEAQQVLNELTPLLVQKEKEKLEKLTALRAPEFVLNGALIDVIEVENCRLYAQKLLLRKIAQKYT